MLSQASACGGSKEGQCRRFQAGFFFHLECRTDLLTLLLRVVLQMLLIYIFCWGSHGSGRLARSRRVSARSEIGVEAPGDEGRVDGVRRWDQREKQTV